QRRFRTQPAHPDLFPCPAQSECRLPLSDRRRFHEGGRNRAGNGGPAGGIPGGSSRRVRHGGIPRAEALGGRLFFTREGGRDRREEQNDRRVLRQSLRKRGGISMKPIHTDRTPAAIGPYAQAMRVGNFLFTSGQIPLKPTGELVTGDIVEQTHQVFANLRAILQAAGTDLNRVVKTTVYLADMNDFSKVNEVYATYFPEHRPARSCVEVSRLPKDVGIE